MDIQNLQNLVRELLEKLTIEVKSLEVSGDSAKSTIIAVEIDEPRFFLDRGGEALQALNHLTHRILENKNKEEETEKNFLIDINGFEKKHIENIEAIAHMMSERARYFKSNIEIDPMTAFERRIIHEYLANEEDLKTESIGTGRTRRVVIKYIGSI